jgi:putative membrane protein
MNRRNLIAGVGLILATPAFRAAIAQKPQDMTPDRQHPGPAEDKHMKQTAAVGSFSLLISRVALTKVQNPKVLEFVKFEVAEQNTISDIIKNMNKPASAASGQVVPPTDEQAMAHLDPGMDAKIQQLKGLSGGSFDKAYLQAEVEGHQRLLSIQEAYLSAGHDREELSLAKLAKGMIQEHLQLLNDLHAG